MLQAYVDESVSDFGDKHFFLCAYVLPVRAWMAFSSDWDRVLRDAPPISYLHMSDAWACDGEFSGWDKQARDAKVAELGKVIEKYQPLAVQVSVSKKLYDEIIMSIVPYHMRNPYSWLFVAMVYGIPQATARFNSDMPVEFILDDTTAGFEAAMWYDYLKAQQPELGRRMGGTPTFRDDKNVMPLQAADMLAWHARRLSERRSEVLPAAQFLYKYLATIEADESSLRSMATGLAAVPGIERVRQKRDWQGCGL